MPISDDKFLEMYGSVKATEQTVRAIQSDVAALKLGADETRRDHEDRLKSLEADRDRAKTLMTAALSGGPVFGGALGWVLHKLFP